MPMDPDFGGVIWTNHALERLSERGIKQGDAWVTFRRPQQSRYAENKGAWIYYRDFGNSRIEVVAKQNEKKEWVVLSVWSSFIPLKTQSVRPKNESMLKRLLKFIGVLS